MRTSTLAAALTLLALLAAGPAAAADNSFSGSCKEIEGVAKFDTPLTNTASDNRYHFTGSGKCTGKLNGRDVTDAPIDAQVDGAFNGSCSSGKSTAPGPGYLKFTGGNTDAADDVIIRFTMEFTSTASEVDFTLKGEKSGDATGHASFLTTRTPPDLAIKCQTDGNSELPFDATSETKSPLVSSGPATAETASGGSSNGSGGGGGSGSGAGGGGGGSGNSSQAPASQSAASVEIPEQSLADALKNGVRVICRAAGPATCVLTLSIPGGKAKKYKLKSTKLGTATGKIASGASEGVVVIKLNAKARKALKKAKSLAVTVSGKVNRPGGTTPVKASGTLGS